MPKPCFFDIIPLTENEGGVFVNGNNTETLEGKIENVVYHNESNDYTVLEISTPAGDLITAVGIIPMAYEGEEVILKGGWTYHKEFGKQFAFDAFEKNLPHEVEGILQYLSSRTVKGVGPVTALKIVNKFGAETFDIIENHPEWLTDIPGITMKKAAQISESFKQQTGIRGVMMFCRDYMNVGEITRVYKKFGVGAVGLLEENPYILYNSDLAIPFDKIDAFALANGHPRDSEKRIESGLEHILSYNAHTNGHTCLPKEKLSSAAAELLELPEDIILQELEMLLSEDILSSYKKDDTVYVMTSSVANNEECIAKRLSGISEEAGSFGIEDIASLIEKVEITTGLNFAPLQREALFSALLNGVMILTGGPGTGKTTVIKALINIFNSLGIKSVLAAPTGRAAKRMSEATSEEAKTVHRMLEMERAIDDSTRFLRNEKNPLTEGVVIVDEASMLDLFLTSALLRAMKRGSRLILIGDSDQLPSVGAGNVLADLIATERIRTVRLTEIFRQSKESLIITNAHRINEGTPPVLSCTDNDFFFVNREDERTIPETVATLIMQRLPKTYGRSIKEKIQVITPSRKGNAGVDALNQALQARMNPPEKFKKEKQSHGTVFREGDKVMQVTNNYEIEWEKAGMTGVGLFNGDIGVIEGVNLNEESMTINFDERIVEYPFEILEQLELAYAITVHKSQGSEYPVVIIPMYYCPPMLMTRNLLYTAVTRARSMVILVGRRDIPARMVNNNREIMRYTTLKDRICDYY